MTEQELRAALERLAEGGEGRLLNAEGSLGRLARRLADLEDERRRTATQMHDAQEVLVKMASGDFSGRCTDGGTEHLRDALAYVVNCTVDEVRCLLEERELVARDREQSLLEQSQLATRLALLLRAHPDLIFRITREGWITSWHSPEGALPLSERLHVVGQHLEEVLPRSVAASLMAALADSQHSGLVHVVEFEMEGAQGPARWEARVVASGDDGLVITRNLHERIRAQQAEAALEMTEASLRQSRQIEAVGRLAGGLAGDFNALCQSILSGVEFLTPRVSSQGPVKAELQEIARSAQAAAELTGQLLSFARLHPMEKAVVGLPELIDGLAPLLAGTLPDQIRLCVEREPVTGTVRVDRPRIERALMTLVNHARDAISGEGMITLRTDRVVLDPQGSLRPSSVGQWVRLTVTDTGPGTSAEELRHFFEPFFNAGSWRDGGDALGLAAAHGTIKQSGGEITVESELGRGTTFTVLLPFHPVDSSAAAAAQVTSAPEPAPHVLVVDDTDHLGKAVKRFLSRLGFRVSTARSGGDALALLHAQSAPVDLLITDVVMPGMDGGELAREVRATWPRTRVLFMTGYTEIDPRPRDPGGTVLLRKPFSSDALKHAVLSTLGQR